MKIYLASSWRNKSRVNEVDNKLTRAGHRVFNFTRPTDQDGELIVHLPKGFSWSEIDPNWQNWTKEQYRDVINGHHLAGKGLDQDYSAMRWADACVAVQPFGRSASLELGWFIGAGKPALIILDGGEPELMFGLATKLCLDDEEALCSLGRLHEFYKPEKLKEKS